MTSAQSNNTSPDINNVSAWTQADYALLTSDIILSLSTTQIQQMLHPEWVPLPAVSGLSAVQLANITPSLASVSAVWLNSLTITALQGLTTPQAGQLTTAIISGVDNSHLSALSATQVAALHGITSLSKAQFGLLNLTAILASAMSGWGQSSWAGLTAAQMSLLTNDQIDAMQNATWLPLSAVSGIQPSQVLVFTKDYGRFNADWFNHMRLDSFQMLDSSRLAQISATIWAQIDNAHITALTPTQIGTVVQHAFLTSAQFALLDLTAVSPAAMSGWGQSSWSGLTAAQMSLLTNDQINAMQSASWLPLGAVSGIQPSQVLVFTSNYGRFNAAWFNQMKLASFQALDNDRLAQIPAATWAQIDMAHFSALNATQISVIKLDFSAISADWMSSLSPATFQGLTTTQLGQLTAAATAGISDTCLSLLTATQLGALSDLSQLNGHQFSLLTLSAMSTAQIAKWTPDQYATLTAAEFGTLSTAQIGAMTNPAALPLTVVSTLTVTQVNAINTDFSRLPDNWLNSLSTTALQGLTPYQFSHLSTLTPAEVNNITSIAALSNAQFSQLNLAGVSASVMAGWSQHVWAGLTAAQVAPFSKEQIESFQYASWLPVTAAAGLLPWQMALLSSYYTQFSADWFNHLQLASFTALDTSRLNQISTSALSGMDSAHLTALSAAQVASMNNLGAMAYEKFGLLNLSAFSANQMSALTKTQYHGLTQAQMDTFNTTQIHALTHPEWLPPGLLNYLSLTQFQSMTTTQFAALTPAAISHLDAAHLAYFGGDLTTLNDDMLLSIESRLTDAQRSTLTPAQQSLVALNQSTEQSLIGSLSDLGLKNIMQSLDAGGESLFSFRSIESVMKSFAVELTDGLSTSQYSDLISYLQDIGLVQGSTSATYSLVNGMVTGANGASVQWVSPSDGSFTRIGSLTVGSTSGQFNQFIANWFDGTNEPASSSSVNIDGRALFADNTPTIRDIHQGYIGDCSLLGGLLTVVNVAPDFIKSMIVQNTNDTYSVRFFNQGVADWVTVNGKGYSNGEASPTSSWAAIIERACVAFESTYHSRDNTYSCLPDYGDTKLATITGNTVTSYSASHYSEEAWNTTVFDILKTAVLAGQPTDMGSWISTNDSTHFINAHEMAILSFDQDTNKFVIGNPWGVDWSGGTFEASMDQMWQGGASDINIANSTGATAATGQLVTAMAGIVSSSSPASLSLMQAVNSSPPLLIASQAA